MQQAEVFSLGLTGGSEVSKIRYELKPTERGTEINYRFEVTFKGLLQLLEPFIKLFKRLIIKQEQARVGSI